MKYKVKPLTYKEVTLDFSEINFDKFKYNPEKLIIGQPRAIKALQIGTEIQAKGYNIFVTGQPGTGRKTTIKKRRLQKRRRLK